MKRLLKNKKLVLIAVVKCERDLELIRNEHWYRIPARYAPVRQYTHIAFYQPAVFGIEGKQIRYFAKVRGNLARVRSDLLPNEHSHPRARDLYVQVRLGRIQKLAHPVQNTTPRRVSFGFSTIKTLKRAKNILNVYAVIPSEAIIGRLLRHMRIRATPQYRVTCDSTRFRLDFAIISARAKIAIECDNVKVHRSAAQKEHDRFKDIVLKKHGWRVIRITDVDIATNLKQCARLIKKNCV